MTNICSKYNRAKSIFWRVLRAIKLRIAKPFIILNIRLVTKIKPLKIIALQVLNYIPALKARLAVLLPAKIDSECPVIIEIKPKAFFSPEGRNIYMELMAKMEQRT